MIGSLDVIAISQKIAPVRYERARLCFAASAIAFEWAQTNEVNEDEKFVEFKGRASRNIALVGAIFFSEHSTWLA